MIRAIFNPDLRGRFQVPSAVIQAAAGEAVAVLVHNRPSADLVPAKTCERLMERLEDLALAELVRARAGESRIPVTPDEL